MAESSSSALPGGVEWLPTLGGAHLLRAEVRGAPPVLVLHTTEGEEQRIEPGPQARFDGTTTYMVPAGTTWSRASLAWPDGTRAVLPTQAAVIALPRRRVEKALPRPEPLPWTAPPWTGASDTEVAATAATRRPRRVAQADEVSLLAAIAEQLEAERGLHGATRGELEAERGSHGATRGELEAERGSHGATREELDAERTAHAETRETLAEALAAARAARGVRRR